MSEEDFTGLVAVGPLEGSDKFRKMPIWWVEGVDGMPLRSSISGQFETRSF